MASGARCSELVRFTTDMIDYENTAFDGLFLETTSKLKVKGRGVDGKYIERYILEAGADIVTFHLEATDVVDECIETIKKHGKKCAISIKPNTPAEAVYPYLDRCDMILVMTVEPGFGGQKFMPSSIAKCEYLNRKKQELGLENLIIEVDGGISASNSRLLFDAGAEALVAGSSVFGAESPEQAIIDMLNS